MNKSIHPFSVHTISLSHSITISFYHYLCTHSHQYTPSIPTLPLRAYGAVFKAVHKESGQLLAIKQVPVDSDLQDIIKEISIMQQCDR